MRLDIKYMALRAANITGKEIDVPRDWLEEYTVQVLEAAAQAAELEVAAGWPDLDDAEEIAQDAAEAIRRLY